MKHESGGGDNEIVATSRQVIEGKLLTALGDGSSVAILLTRENLDDLIGWLTTDDLDGEEDYQKCHRFMEDLKQLRKAAFGV